MKMGVGISFVSIVSQRLAIPRDGEPRFIAECRKTRKAKASKTSLWFDEIEASILGKHYPRMSGSVSSVLAKDDS